jgi:acylphosphatase
MQNPVMNITRHLRIAGRVQGVGYRYSLCTEAQANGINGWVRNRRDGTVEAVVQGSPAALERLMAWARHGPPGARVTAVDVQDARGEFDRPYEGFDQLPSV